MESPERVPFCAEKQRLLREFTEAVSECHRMQSAQLEALLNEDDIQFEEQIQDANTRRQKAKYAILAHRESHGC
jgi:hypothetical protein